MTTPWVAAVVPVLVLAVPIFDTTLVTVSRIRRGRNPLTTPGRDHLSHRLLRLGGSVRGAVARVYVAGLAWAALAIVVARGGPRLALGAALVGLLAGSWGILKLDGSPGSPADDVGSWEPGRWEPAADDSRPEEGLGPTSRAKGEDFWGDE